MLLQKKRAIMGIGTLIIFIATILVAAVAAAVLISTSNVLQQRSLLVGQEARKSITNAIQVISIMSASNSTDESFNDFEIFIRLSPGSDALQMRLFDIQFISSIFDEGADLFYVENQTSVTVGEINTSWSDVYDMDGDGIVDTVRVLNNSLANEDLVQFNLSYLGLSDNISLNVDLSNAGAQPKNFNLDEIAVTYDQEVYGIFSITNGYANEDMVINSSSTSVVKETPEECSFQVLQPETKYCYVIVNGNGDTVLNSGERFKLLYKVKKENSMSTGSDFSFIFTNEKGRMTEANARTPDVVVSTKTKLWPLG